MGLLEMTKESNPESVYVISENNSRLSSDTVESVSVAATGSMPIEAHRRTQSVNGGQSAGRHCKNQHRSCTAPNGH